MRGDAGGDKVKIFNRIRKFFNNAANNNDNVVDANKKTWLMSEIMDLFSGKGDGGAYGQDISEITYFMCVKILSESISKIPCYLIDKDKQRVMNHDTNYILSVRPNQYQTPSQFFNYLEYCRNHRGNAFAYVNRLPNGEVEGLYPLNPSTVQIWIDNRNTDDFTNRKIYYCYSDSRNGKTYWFSPEEILHFRSWLCEDNGLVGKSARSILETTLLGAKASSKFLSNLNRKGLQADIVVKYIGDLKKESQDTLLDEIEEQARTNDRRMITLPMGFEVQPLNTSLADAQFVELRKLTSLQIAGAFGIPPDYINDLEKSSYASSSAQNLKFYINTLLPIISQYEQEMNIKLLTRKEIEEKGYKFKFNVNVILRADPEQQASIVQTLVQSAVYTPNEARRWLDLPSVGEIGDKILVNGSMTTLENAGAAYEKKAGDE